MKIRKNLLFLALLFAPLILFAQAPVKLNSSELLLKLKKLNNLGRVLYLAAHPDDENTRMIAYLSNEGLYDTGYLSITRGDGGQNLIGPEIRELLGIIRTQELLEARKIDGGEQFFTRANDFGFSKHPDETFQIWDKELVLADVVWVIRNFRPDVIITRFDTTPGVTHGHHTASAILAEEAFVAASDPKMFPEQLKYVEVWQTKRLFWNTSSWFFANNEDFEERVKGMVRMDVGKYNPLLGKSYPEIAALSRSMHKSQGFGSTGTRGEAIEYLDQKLGDKARQDIFENINTSWTRVKGGEKVSRLLDDVIRNYKPEDPSTIVPQLLRVRSVMQEMPGSPYKETKIKELENVIKACLGLFIELTAKDYSANLGESVALDLEVINRSDISVKLQSLSLTHGKTDSIYNVPLRNNELVNKPFRISIPDKTSLSQPYWLRKAGTEGMFNVDEQTLIGLPENPPVLNGTIKLVIGGQNISYQAPVVYKKNDPVQGELYRPFEIVPPVSVNIQENVYVFADESPKDIVVKVKAGKAGKTEGKVSLKLPKGWKADPEHFPYTLNQKGEEQSFFFTLRPATGADEGEIYAVASLGNKTYDRSLVHITYGHIATQTLFPEAKAKVVKPDLEKRGQNIGYMMGAGDDIPQSLEQIGYKVKLLGEHDLSLKKLTSFDAVILGVRAFNTNDYLKFKQPLLLEYVKQGGTVIVQYNTSMGLVTNDIGPYPLKLSRDRITVETAPVRILKPGHQIMNFPNKITEKDFEDWVQERGLYFPSSWDDQYVPILSSNDPGEDEKKGGLLVAEYGEGYFIYTGYSWFRQLPAGVPGAFRIFANMISIGKSKKDH